MLNGCPCPEPWTWILQAEDGKQHETCAPQAVKVLEAIVNEYGDGSPVFVWRYTKPEES